ncbi:MAG: EAL domain-containing protein [Candidatus Gracilibacteria bacterium]|nr:EAL domain-containing protein [Candidatus Gracilibacteria bacterium]
MNTTSESGNSSNTQLLVFVSPKSRDQNQTDSEELTDAIQHAQVDALNFFRSAHAGIILKTDPDDIVTSLEQIILNLSETIALVVSKKRNDKIAFFLTTIRDIYETLLDETRIRLLRYSTKKAEELFYKAHSETEDQFWGILEILHQQSSEEIITETRDAVDISLYQSPEADIARNILQYNNVSIFGQGIYNVDGKKIDEEVLMRGMDAEGKIIGPERIIKGMEDIRQLDTLDWLIIENTCIYISVAGKHNETYGINVNPITFSRADFYDRITRLFERYKINERNVILEILEYERFLPEDSARVDEMFGKLRKLGIRIAVDDYPSGSNTLAQVSRFQNIDIIKIDGIHVMEMFRTCSICDSLSNCKDLVNQSAARNDTMCLKDIYHDYKFETLVFSMRFLRYNYPHIQFFAERVEDESVLNFLKSFDLIEGFQGYYFDKPKLLATSELLQSSMKGVDIDEADLERSSLKFQLVELDDYLEADVSEIPEAILMPSLNEFAEYTDQINHYSLSVITLHSFLRSGKTFYDIKDAPHQIEALASVLGYLGANRINFYEILGEIVIISSFGPDGTYETKKIAKDPGISRVKKNYINFYRLLNGNFDIERASFPISRVPVPGEGDDIVIKVRPNTYLGIDDCENAVYHSKSAQINMLILFIIAIQDYR